MLRPALLALATLAAAPGAWAQLSSITAAQLEPDVLVQDFNGLPDGPISGTDPAFTSINVTNVSLFGTFTVTGDTLGGGGVSNALCSRANVLTVSAPGGAIDNPQPGGGNGWHFDILGGAATQVGFTVVDETGASIVIEVFSGGLPLGSASFSSSAGQLRLWESAVSFDAFEIRAGGYAGGWAIDDITVAGFGPGCVINAPAPAATVMATVTVDHDLLHSGGLPVDVSYEYTTDAGVSWWMCTEASGGPNPALGISTPDLGRIFDWDSIADLVGLSVVQTSELRITVTDGARTSDCQVRVDVDNLTPPPTCTLTLLSATPVAGLADVELLADSVNAASVDATFEFSTDGGASFLLATPGPGGVNPMAGVPLLVPTAFSWDSDADGVGQSVLAPGVLLRSTVDDLVAVVTGDCTTPPFDVDNTALCSGICGDCSSDGIGPAITDALTAAQIAAGLVTPTPLQTGCCDVDATMTITVTDALRIAQFAAGLPATLTCP